jgi:hypothetical protein
METARWFIPTVWNGKKLKKATWNYQGIPQGEIFYVWKALGRGATGQAFLACDSKGAACVLKFYLYDDTLLRKLEANQRAAIENNMLLEAHKLANLEDSRWKEVYPQYSSRVRVVKVNKLWALQMPYFNPVPTSDKLDTLPRIMKVLMAFEDKGYRYKRSYLRWRHIGLDADNNCVLFDLESLQKGAVNEDDIAGDLAFFEGPGLALTENTYYNQQALCDASDMSTKNGADLFLPCIVPAPIEARLYHLDGNLGARNVHQSARSCH